MRLWSDCHLEIYLVVEPINLPDDVLFIMREKEEVLRRPDIYFTSISRGISDYKVLQILVFRMR